MWLPCGKSYLARRHSRFIMLLAKLAFLSFLTLTCARLIPDDELATGKSVTSTQAQPWRILKDNYETQGLLSFRATMRDANESLPSWDPATDPCSGWDGVVCEGGRVVTIKLVDLPKLSPSLVSGLSNLESLRELTLQNLKLRGPIPTELGNLKLLETLNLANNKINGSLPVELSYATKLTFLDASDNQLKGPLPVEFANLRSLMFLSLAFNRLSGSIPDEMAAMPNLLRLYLNGNGFKSMPSSFSAMTSVVELDLSRNKIEGDFPSSLFGLPTLSYVNLFDNMLKGPLPEFIGNQSFQDMPQLQMDFSFNYLQGNTTPDGFLKSSFAYNCFGLNNSQVMSTPGQRNVSSCGKVYDVPSCDCPPPLRFSPDGSCNCTLGMKFTLQFLSRKLVPIASVTFNNHLSNTTEELATQLGMQPAQIVFDIPQFLSAPNQTKVLLHGSFLPMEGNRFNPTEIDRLISRNGTQIAFNVPFYENEVGIVNLEEVNLPDFPPTTPSSPLDPPPDAPPPPDNPVASDNPLKKSKGMTYGTGVFVALVIIAIALAVAALVVMWLLILYCRRRHAYDRDLGAILPDSDDDKKGLQARSHRRQLSRGRSGKHSMPLPEENPLLDVAHSMRRFTYSELEAATAGFDESRRLGSGGFGIVYRGLLSDGTVVAVKVLAANSVQGDKEFRNEVQIIGTVHNRHVVSLVGYCIDEDDRILVYEYVPNGSLEDAIFDGKYPVKLGWDQCVVIFEGTARGITYLHEECRFKIIHRDIKPGNVLLDDDFEARVSDFGLARNTVVEDSHVTTRVVGTLGYMAPEYSATGQLTEKSDVYSFGVLMLVVLSGRKPTGMDPPGSVCSGLVPCAFMAHYENRLLSLIGTRFEGQYSRPEAERLLSIALLCAHPEPSVRPIMSQVVTLLTTTGEPPKVPKMVPYKAPEPSPEAAATSVLPEDDESSRETVGHPDGPPGQLDAAKHTAVSRCQTWSHTVFPDSMLTRRSFNRLPSSPPRLSEL